MNIRPAEAGDLGAIRAVHRAAFPTAAEADLVEALEREGDAVGLAGRRRRRARSSAMSCSAGWRSPATGAPIGRSASRPSPCFPAFRDRGIGAALIEGALAIARATGEELVFVLGEPDYYRRFGFSAEAAAPFASPYAGPYFMALGLRPGLRAAPRQRGTRARLCAACLSRDLWLSAART